MTQLPSIAGDVNLGLLVATYRAHQSVSHLQAAIFDSLYLIPASPVLASLQSSLTFEALAYSLSNLAFAAVA